MAEDVAARLQGIRQKQQEAERRRSAVEAKIDSARAQRDKALEALKEMGYATIEEARTRAVELKQETETALAEIENQVKDL